MSWIQPAKVGDKVACVLDVELIEDSAESEILPQKGEIYTIRDIEPGEDGIFLRFVEIVNVPGYYLDGFGECSFHEEGFRPVEPRKTDISFAHDILRKATKPVTEDA
jgi:hypothetical protein